MCGGRRNRWLSWRLPTETERYPTVTTGKRKLRIVDTPEHNDNTLDLTHYEEVFLDCRGLQHVWASVGFFQDGGYVSRLVRCSRCGTEKIMTMRHNGTLVRSRYEHPEGYLMKGSALSKADVRVETLRRAEKNTFGSLEELHRSLTKRRKGVS